MINILQDRPLNYRASNLPEPGLSVGRCVEMNTEAFCQEHIYRPPGGFGDVDRARTNYVRGISVAGKVRRETFIAYQE